MIGNCKLEIEFDLVMLLDDSYIWNVSLIWLEWCCCWLSGTLRLRLEIWINIYVDWKRKLEFGYMVMLVDLTLRGPLG